MNASHLGKQNKSKHPVAGCNTGLVRELSSGSDSCEDSSGCIGAVDASDIHLGKHRLYCYAIFVILVGVFCSAKVRTRNRLPFKTLTNVSVVSRLNL